MHACDTVWCLLIPSLGYSAGCIQTLVQTILQDLTKCDKYRPEKSHISYDTVMIHVKMKLLVF